MTLALKTYQTNTLDLLERYFTATLALGRDPARAFAQVAQHEPEKPLPPYRALPELEGVPYVCLRIPTGGGKTVMGAHIIERAAKSFLERELPLVLWLVPTRNILNQTLEAFRNPRHPYRRELDDKFASVRVFAIDEIEQIRPVDLEQSLTLVVATFATARVADTELRDVYAHKEALEPHFLRLPSALLDQLEKTEHGKPRFSFANLLKVHRPLVVTDEAHNASTKLSYEVYRRLSPAAVVELTATPDAAASNVLVRVSAAELKAEDMIKLPVVVTEHPDNWQSAVGAALQRRKALADVAKTEREFVRPILLIQAENKDKPANVDAVLEYLKNQENVDADRIAIATGEQRELDGVDLFARDCKVDVVVTVQALKEGWDCSFAYVFCSTANIHSARDVEQLLGRVLRMPYARKREHAELNKAYAHVVSASFGSAALELTARLGGMGFEEREAAGFIEPDNQPALALEGGAYPPQSVELRLAVAPRLDALSPQERKAVVVEQTADGSVVVRIDNAVVAEVGEKLVASLPKKEQVEARRALDFALAQQAIAASPAKRGEVFEVPRLCLSVQGELALVERELILDLNGWSLSDFAPELPSMRFEPETNTFVVDIERDHLEYRHSAREPETQYGLLQTEWSVNDLVRWLDQNTRQHDINQPILLDWLRRLVEGLMTKEELDLATLARAKFVLARVVKDRIDSCRHAAYLKGYQQTLFAQDAPVECSFEFAFKYHPDVYPARSYFRGAYRLSRHFYGADRVGELDYRDGKGEEFLCAQAIDALPGVRYWVRNLALQPQCSFWLPTATDRFYPDFVALLEDGRVLVVEYKGEPYKTNDDSKEKTAIGELWERKSAGKGLFLMAVGRDERARDVRGQLAEKIAR